jgi:UDP-N-acetylmuramoyl-tripeptide--D-alanyl-D-alanine ligase
MLTKEMFKNCPSYISGADVLPEGTLSLSTDTRNLVEGQIFLAIQGEKFNPLTFIKDIENKRCRFVVFTDTYENHKLISSFETGIQFICVKDSVSFLQEIAKQVSICFQNKEGKLVAISGSNGKTTTKEMLYHLLNQVCGKTICTQKNLNNHIGVPLTLLQINHETQYAVVELGSNHPGEIKVLCDICVPHIGVTTNIGDTHLEFFQNRRNVFLEEGFLCEAILNNSSRPVKLFINTDDEYLKIYAERPESITFGSAESDYIFMIENDHAIVKNNHYEYKFTNNYITGKHNFFNLCVAFIIAKEITINFEDELLKAAETFRPTANRSQWLELKNSSIFLDAYNANPSSMKAAITGFVDKIHPSENYCLIVGDMNELGKDASSHHIQLAEFINENNYHKVIYVGRYAQHYMQVSNIKAQSFESTAEFKNHFKENILGKYKYIFIKGSRSLQLESLLDIT